MSDAQAQAAEYESSLGDLTVNSKPLINVLTMLAEENIAIAPLIVKAIENHIQTVIYSFYFTKFPLTLSASKVTHESLVASEDKSTRTNVDFFHFLGKCMSVHYIQVKSVNSSIVSRNPSLVLMRLN